MSLLTRAIMIAAVGAVALATFVLRCDEGGDADGELVDWFDGGRQTAEAYWEQRAADYRATYEPD